MLYKTSATVTQEGRNGRAFTDDGLLDVPLAAPRELGGMGGATNPEQLFAAGYAACFISAIHLCAREAKLSVGPPEVTCHSELERASDGKFQLVASLDVSLPNAIREDAETVARMAHGICPYSRATRGNVDVKVRVVQWKGSEGAPALDLDHA